MALDPEALSGQPVFIPIGDFNGDTYEDYIFSVDDSIAANVPTIAHITFGDENSFCRHFRQRQRDRDSDRHITRATGACSDHFG